MWLNSFFGSLLTPWDAGGGVRMVCIAKKGVKTSTAWRLSGLPPPMCLADLHESGRVRRETWVGRHLVGKVMRDFRKIADRVLEGKKGQTHLDLAPWQEAS